MPRKQKVRSASLKCKAERIEQKHRRGGSAGTKDGPAKISYVHDLRERNIPNPPKHVKTDSKEAVVFLVLLVIAHLAFLILWIYIRSDLREPSEPGILCPTLLELMSMPELQEMQLPRYENPTGLILKNATHIWAREYAYFRCRNYTHFVVRRIHPSHQDPKGNPLDFWIGTPILHNSHQLEMTSPWRALCTPHRNDLVILVK